MRDETQTWVRRKDPFSSYRAGFEIRTYRRCKRVLMFHPLLPQEPYTSDNPGPVVVQSTDFRYEENPQTLVSQLVAVTQRGYRAEPNPSQQKAYLSEELELELGRPGVKSSVYHIKITPAC